METIQADLVVIGGGLAGHRCALEAARAGATVVLLEKMPRVGGSTVMSGGSIAFAGTDLQRSAGIEDSPERLKDDLLNVSGGYADPALIDVVASGQLAEYRFLTSRNIPFGPVQSSSGQSVPRVHSTPSSSLIDCLNTELNTLSNVSVLTDTRAMRLQQQRGRFAAVLADRKGTRIRLEAARGIVLTTGGFSRGLDLLRKFAPDASKALPAGGLGNEGDGLKLACEFGANLLDVGFVKGTFGGYFEAVPGEHYTVLLPIYRGAIAVNTKGQRFVDESKSYKTLGAACLEQDRALAYQIFDAAIMAQSMDTTPSFNFRLAERKGRIVSADSIAQLAAALKLPPEQLQETIAQYNADIAAGGDSRFGRSSLVHTHGTPVPIAAAPYYAYPTTTAINSTYAGVQVAPDMTVINVWGERMEGLYAAGEVTGGFHGEAYMTGSSLLKALVCGAVAARSALSGR